MNEFEKALSFIDNFCKKNSIDYAVIGGIAVVTYGSLRTTKDIDITLLCEIDELESIHNIFIEEFIPLISDSLTFFKQNFVLPLKHSTIDVRFDIIAGLTGFDKNMISRRKRIQFGEVEFYVCSLEDLIIYKLFGKRFQDLADISDLIRINKKSLDTDYLLKQTSEFIDLGRDDMIQDLKNFLSQ